jgi:hypothetical protein
MEMLEIRAALRRQTLYPAELRAHRNGKGDFRAFLDQSKKKSHDQLRVAA